MTRSPHRCLVLGGARSGKSSWAEARLADRPVRYIATGYPDSVGDTQWRDRVRAHRARRPAGWTTIETLHVADLLSADDDRPILIDCAGLWLTRTLDALNAWVAPDTAPTAVGPHIERFAAAFAAAQADVVIVSNEVGSGVVPESPSGRLFADLLGVLNMRLARVSDEVVLMVAGIPVAVKGGPPDRPADRRWGGRTW